eukprot:PhF_6_TR37825/c0_g1_i1/m.56310
MFNTLSSTITSCDDCQSEKMKVIREAIFLSEIEKFADDLVKSHRIVPGHTVPSAYVADVGHTLRTIDNKAKIQLSSFGNTLVQKPLGGTMRDQPSSGRLRGGGDGLNPHTFRFDHIQPQAPSLIKIRTLDLSSIKNVGVEIDGNSHSTRVIVPSSSQYGDGLPSLESTRQQQYMFEKAVKSHIERQNVPPRTPRLKTPRTAQGRLRPIAVVSTPDEHMIVNSIRARNFIP